MVCEGFAARWGWQAEFSRRRAWAVAGHLMGVAIATALNVKPEHVPYKSTAEALTDVVSGQVPFSTSTLSSTSGFLHAHTLIGIAVTSDTEARAAVPAGSEA